MLSLTSLVRGSGGRLEFTGHGFLVISTVMEAQPGGGRVTRLVAEGLDPISLPNLEFDSPDQLLGAVSSSIGLSNASSHCGTPPRGPMWLWGSGQEGFPTRGALALLLDSRDSRHRLRGGLRAVAVGREPCLRHLRARRPAELELVRVGDLRALEDGLDELARVELAHREGPALDVGVGLEREHRRDVRLGEVGAVEGHERRGARGDRELGPLVPEGHDQLELRAEGIATKRRLQQDLDRQRH